MAAMRRVVVTGMGIVCPLGLGVENVWKRLIDERIRHQRDPVVRRQANCRAKIAGQVPAWHQGGGEARHLRVDPGQGPARRWTASSSSPWSAATEAVEDSGWKPETEEDRCATGVMIGSGIGGLETIYEASILVHEGKARRLSPFFIPSALINLASGQVSIKYGFKGPNHSVVTACATGVHAIGDAARLIMLGDAEVMVAGGDGGRLSIRSASPASAPRARSPPRSTTRRRRPRARGTRTATGSSWARAPASSCWRSTSTPASAARRSMPRSAATACPATPIHITAPAEGP